MQLLVGLGNPGEKYRHTRHNLGFMVLDSISPNFKLEKKYNSEIANISILNANIRCIKPQTYMNRSGEAVAGLVNFYQIDPKDCLVIHDELDLPFGEVRLKFGGGEGGHNGLKSISLSLGTRDYPRLRIGIGKPLNPNYAIEDWVLSRFLKDESDILGKVLKRAEEAIFAIIENGFAKAQTKINSLSSLVPNNLEK